jgi:MtN3 and saliva related transmembrane protein
MDYVSLLGKLAAISSAIVFIPQVIKTIKTKDTKSISLGMYIIVVLSNSIWTAYAFLVHETAILLAQVFLLPMSALILIYKIKYK